MSYVAISYMDLLLYVNLLFYVNLLLYMNLQVRTLYDMKQNIVRKYIIENTGEVNITSPV